MEELAGVLEADTAVPDRAAAIELVVQGGEGLEVVVPMVREDFLVNQYHQDLRAHQECQSI